MKRFVRRAQARARPSFVLWVLMLPLVSSVTLCASLDLPSKAKGPEMTEVARAALPAPAEESTSLAPAAFVPLVFDNYWGVLESPLGVHANFLSLTVVDEVTQAGASWIRVPLYWSQIEPQNTTPEHYQWSAAVDYSVALLAARNVNVIFTLWQNPEWAATYPMGPIDKVDRGELAEFMRAAVARYGAPPYNVKYWEVYNEPDNEDELYAATGSVGFFGHQPKVYVQTLAAIYGPIKAVDPQAQILLGGLAYDRWTSEGLDGSFAEGFLDGVLQNGGGSYFDVMNFHYYNAFREKWDPYGPGLIGKATALRQKLASYGVDKPFMCTETGLSSDAAHGSSEELQARHVPKVFARTMAADLQATTWYRLFDTDQAWAWQFGLLDVTARRKPSFHAFQTAYEQLAPATYLRAWASAETGSEQIEAYEFLASGGGTRIVVAWTEDGQNHSLVLEAGRVVMVEKSGGQTLLRDGDDGQVDGRVRATVGPSPLYLRFQP
jgi:hypothetical protein